jgi:antitoxin MazE
MRVRIQKWGNSLALRIPKPFALETGVTGGAEVELTVDEGRLVASPVRPPRFTLEGLLRGVRRGNRHAEVESGEPQGREAW